VRGHAVSADRVAAALRAGEPPVIARIVDGAVVLDLRTVDRRDDAVLVKAVRAALRTAEPARATAGSKGRS
jgi:L-seryl-tRNA(Ser) seleniumtransferase